MAGGLHIIREKPHFEDYTSFSKWLSGPSGPSNLRRPKIIRYKLNQTGTGGEVELSEKGGLTIAFLGKTALGAMRCATSHDAAGYRGKTVTLVYVTNAGVEKTAVATLNAGNSTTEVAFSPVVTDFYAAVSCTANFTPGAGHTVLVGVTGLATPIATIRETGASAGQADLQGVGNLFIAEEADTAADLGLVITIIYVTPWGTIKTCTGTLDAGNSTTVVRCYDADGVSVKDFYRLRQMYTTQNVGKYVAIGDDTSLTNKLGVIEEALHFSIHSRYMVPSGYRAWLCRIKAGAGTAAARITATFTIADDVASVPYQVPIPVTTVVVDDVCEELEPLSEASFTVLGNTAVVDPEIIIVEAQEV